MRKNRISHLASAGGAIALLAIFSGAIAAAVPNANPSVLSVCVSRASGQVRAVSNAAECKSSEYFTEIRSGEQGPTGPAGLQGATGPTGPAGAAGADGRTAAGLCRGGNAMVGVKDDATIICSEGNQFSNFTFPFAREGVESPQQIRLTNSPASDVDVRVTSRDPDSLLINGEPSAVVTITPENWEDPPAVTLSTPTDADNESPGPIVVTMSHINPVTPSSQIPESSQTIPVFDQIVQRAIPNVSTLSIRENETATFAFHLATPPFQFDSHANVQVRLGHLTVDIEGAESQVARFTSTNYAVDRVVAVHANDDADTNDGDGSVCISLHPAFDPGAAEVCLPITILDDDEEQAVIVPTQIMVDEGSTIEVPVRLAMDPGGSFEVGPFCLLPLACDEQPVVFDSGNWGVNQTFLVTASVDSDSFDEVQTVAVCPFDGVTDCVEISVTIVDRESE